MKKRLVKLSMIFISVIFLISCRGEEGDSLKKDKDLVLEDNKIVEDSLILNLQGGDWGYLSPFVHYTRGPGYYKMRLIFDSLLERGEEGLIPSLAESWEIDEEGKSYIFKIREVVVHQRFLQILGMNTQKNLWDMDLTFFRIFYNFGEYLRIMA